MTERPILFSGPLVQAILDGRKTETRRFVTPATSIVEPGPWAQLDDCDRLGSALVSEWLASAIYAPDKQSDDSDDAHKISPRIQPGDMLWVRETWQPIGGNINGTPGVTVRYNIDGQSRAVEGEAADAWRRKRMAKYGEGWTRSGGRSKGQWPGIHMPRWASRLELRVLEVRAERLQAITTDGALAEGVSARQRGFVTQSPRAVFADLWDSIYGKQDGASWVDDPWVWVYRYELDRQASRV